MTEPVDFLSQQELNRRRSRRLLGGFIVFFAWLGFGGDYILALATSEAEGYRHVFPWFGIALTGFGLAMAWYAWQKGPEMVLWSSGAWELLEPVGPQQQLLANVVEEMAIAAGLPRPRIHIVYDRDANAFATGRDPHSAHVVVTEGLLGLCSREELQGVIGHELGHIKNLDVRLMTLLTGLLGSVVVVRDGLWRLLRHGAMRGGARGGKRGGVPPAFLVALSFGWLVSWLLAPLVARAMILGVSRRREYLADAMSAQFTRNPLALASALEKIERCHEPTLSIREGSAHLCIADPLGRRANAHEGALGDLLGTHPPMSLRVARLRAMGYQHMKRSGTFAVPAA